MITTSIETTTTSTKSPVTASLVVPTTSPPPVHPVLTTSLPPVHPVSTTSLPPVVSVITTTSSPMVITNSPPNKFITLVPLIGISDQYIFYPPGNQGVCEEGFTELSQKGAVGKMYNAKFGGYFEFQSSCAEICRRDYGLRRCVGYGYDVGNRGYCEVYAAPLDEAEEEDNSKGVICRKNN
uniref:WSC domain-containing protein n=1 Tax=Parastrongyloides trichosuri TaxID=131310 RepID=A0A0N4Z6X1_PARTI